MIGGLSHITMVVKDLERSAKLFADLLDAEIAYRSGEAFHSVSEEVFLVAGGLWIALMRGEALNERTYNHVAFRITDADYDRCLEKVKSLGLEMPADRKRMPGEGRSIYFYDYDNHLIELHAGSLEERLGEYGKK